MVNSFSMAPEQRRKWIIVIAGEFYPDYMAQAQLIYGPELVKFGDLLSQANNGDIPIVVEL